MDMNFAVTFNLGSVNFDFFVVMMRNLLRDSHYILQWLITRDAAYC